MYTTVTELGPQNQSKEGFLGPTNSILCSSFFWLKPILYVGSSKVTQKRNYNGDCRYIHNGSIYDETLNPKLSGLWIQI